MTNDQQTALIQYFGYGTNKDLDMMASMVGRRDLTGRPGKLIGHELCIQTLDQIPDTVLETAPAPRSPRDLIASGFGDSFNLYVSRPNGQAVTYGTIWELTWEEWQRVRNWELLDFGMQHDIKGVAMDESGQVVQVITHGLLDPKAPVSKIVEGADYEPYIEAKAEMLRIAEEVLADWIKSQK